jgi:3-oxoacyl-[acyl-carrier protein] reductase
MKLGLKNTVALVTGASRGIGAASAKALAYHGATVVINYIKSKDKAEALLEEIKQAGGNGMTFQADVRDQTAVNSMIDSALDQFGKLDILVNNANINFPIMPFVELAWDQIEAKILDGKPRTSGPYPCRNEYLSGRQFPRCPDQPGRS